jgi:hypothetical protein
MEAVDGNYRNRTLSDFDREAARQVLAIWKPSIIGTSCYICAKTSGIPQPLATDWGRHDEWKNFRIALVECRKPQLIIRSSSALTDADKLNGIEWRGDIFLTAATCRWRWVDESTAPPGKVFPLTGPGGESPNRGEWTEWVETGTMIRQPICLLGNNPLMLNQLPLAISLIRRNGKLKTTATPQEVGKKIAMAMNKGTSVTDRELEVDIAEVYSDTTFRAVQKADVDAFGNPPALGSDHRYHIVFDDPSLPLLRVGVPVAIRGTLLSNGRPAANHSFGVQDGIAQQSYLLKTDGSGRFRLTPTPKQPKAALVSFFADGTFFDTVCFQVLPKSSNNPTSLLVKEIWVQNNSSKPYEFTLTTASAPGSPSVVINPGEKKEIASSTAPVSFSYNAGGTIDAGLISGSATVDNNGVVTYSITGGEGPIRFAGYRTTNGDAGGCWSPGIGTPLVSIEGYFCVGSDGASVGGDASAFGMTGGGSMSAAWWYILKEVQSRPD